MSGSIQDQITALLADIANLQAQVAVDTVTNPGAVPGLEAAISVDEQEILNLELLLCFASGTHILTDRGEVLVENLAVGDMVVTPRATTDSMPIRWIGRQHVQDQRALYGQPVLVRAGALGDGLPHRDLHVSAEHCLFLDGHLVPAKLLVNGTTIIAETGYVQIDYINIELDDHNVVLAEGVESESYLDCGNRSRFDNASETCAWLESRTGRDSSAWHNGLAFAPPIWDGPRLDALRNRLAGRTTPPVASPREWVATITPTTGVSLAA